MAIGANPALNINKGKMDGFLEIPDIKGESKRDGHDEHIETTAISFGMTAPYDSNTLSRKGRVSMGTMNCLKNYDISSPYIAKACYENKQLDEVKIYARRTIDGATSDYLKIVLKEASIVGYSFQVVDGDDDIMEQVSFSYKNIEFTYDDDHTVDMDVGTGM